MTRLIYPLGPRALALALASSLAACAGATGSAGGAEDGSSNSRQGKRGKAEQRAAEETGGDTSDATTPSLPLPKAGIQGTERRALSAEVSLVLEAPDGAAGGISEKGFSLSEERRVMVEAVGSDAITKLSLLYGKRETRGLEGWTPLPTQNNGYTVEGDGSSITILQDGKNPTGATEREVIEAEYGFVGRPHPLLVAVARSKGGEPQRLDEAGRVALLGHNPEITLEEVTVEFGSADTFEGRATLAVEVTVKGSLPDGSLSYSFDLTGTAQIDATTGWITRLELAGNLIPKGTLRAKGRELKAGGKGKIEMNRSTEIQ